VVADVDDMGLLDVEDALAARTERTRAVVPMHLFGSRAPTPDLGVPVVDDACQAVGAEPACSTGVLSAVSAYPTKLWGAAGDGGFVVGDDPELLDRVRALGHHGAVGPHLHDRPAPAWAGRNARLDAVQAAVLVGRAPGLEGVLARRRALVARYDAGLRGPVQPLPRTDGSPASPYVVRSPRRDALLQALHDAGIGASVYYPRSLAAQPALGPGQRPTPRADALSAELLALPLHDTTTAAEVDRVLRAIAEGG
jgi:dTDP-4-amino-4,6-dideoxygalactose transaminase